MSIDCIGFLRNVMIGRPAELAVVHSGSAHDYGELQARLAFWEDRLVREGIGPGRVVSLEGDYTLETIAAFLALTANGNVIVPMSADSMPHAETFRRVAQVEHCLRPEHERPVVTTGQQASHPMYETLRARSAPGLVLFSSGSTGEKKAAVHDLTRLLEKFRTPRFAYRTLVFLQLDHIGGINTLLYTLANGGAVVVAASRSPVAVVEAIERYKVELLPTSPTFLNLLMLSGEHTRHDLSSLKLITYGSEPMPESTLRNAAEAFPQAKLLQTYGLTEVGILRSQSRGSNSLWVRVGGEGYETKVVDDRLWIRAASAMLGYLNAPSPFDADGFFDTGDRVEADGEWLRIIGRESEVINVGGSKVVPTDVESVLLDLENVVEAAVHGEPHPITGQIVVATVRLRDEEPLDAFKVRLRRFCQTRLAPHEVPAKIRLATGPLHSTRFKRMRKELSLSAADTR